MQPTAKLDPQPTAADFLSHCTYLGSSCNKVLSGTVTNPVSTFIKQTLAGYLECVIQALTECHGQGFLAKDKDLFCSKYRGYNS